MKGVILSLTDNIQYITSRQTNKNRHTHTKKSYIDYSELLVLNIQSFIKKFGKYKKKLIPSEKYINYLFHVKLIKY